MNTDTRNGNQDVGNITNLAKDLEQKARTNASANT
jgi:hypothetical protein